MLMNSARVLVVTTEKSLQVLETWLQDRAYDDIFPWLKDKAGHRMVGLNLKLPENKFERAGLVIVRNADLLDRVIEICEAGRRGDD